MAPPSDLLREEGRDGAELLLHDRFDAAQVVQPRQYLRTHLVLQRRLWQACVASLRSDWPQQRWDDRAAASERSLASACENFLERQRRWPERDILAVQRLPLAERVERYPARGSLTFQGTTLDVEGRFLYHLQLPPEAPLARFRTGDSSD